MKKKSEICRIYSWRGRVTYKFLSQTMSNTKQCELERSIQTLYEKKELHELLQKIATVLEANGDSGAMVVTALSKLYESGCDLKKNGSSEIASVELHMVKDTVRVKTEENQLKNPQFAEQNKHSEVKHGSESVNIKTGESTQTQPVRHTTLPYSLIVENDVLERTRKFFPNEVVVKPKKIDGIVGDVLVKGKYIIEVKSGKTDKKQLAKINDYARIYNVGVKVLAAGRFTVITRDLEAFAKQNDINIIYVDSLEKGLEQLEDWTDGDPVIIQTPPLNHISRTGGSFAVLEVATEELFAISTPVELNNKPTQASLWPYAYQIAKLWYAGMATGNPKSTAKIIIHYLTDHEHVDKPPVKQTIEAFADFLINYVTIKISGTD